MAPLKSVALITGHAEAVAPGRPGYAGLLALLEAEGAQVEALHRPRYPAELRGFDALVLGAPSAPLDVDELDALADAVERGAALLLLAQAGGDARPFGDPARATNLSALLPGLTFRDDALHQPSTMEAVDNLQVELEQPALPGLPAGRLAYAAGCTFEVAPGPLRVAHAVAARGPDVKTCVELIPDPEFPEALTSSRPDAVREPSGLAFAELAYGRGRALVLGGARTLHDDHLPREFAAWLLGRLLGLDHPAELARRMRKPQRHRLLQGYPMAPLMARDAGPAPAPPALGQHRPFLVGVLPHPYCNPTVAGCGFCTFPQEKLDRAQLPAIAAAVGAELEAFTARLPRRALPHPAAGLYFGGGTANLTPLPEFERLAARLAEAFGFEGAEVTLEGVPRYFQIGDYAQMRALVRHFPGSRPRISMGVQSFDEGQLAAMGRAGFGDRATFAQVVERAHALGLAASCDLLINLPGQAPEQMVADVEQAAALGFDQVCLYHLVLFEELGTPWAKDPAKLAALPANGLAFESWRRCADRLRELGFTQTTLTNFERPGRPGFTYEPMGFQPDRYDLVGFGPAAISLWSDAGFTSATKALNPTRAAEYLAPGRPERRRFEYGPRDLRLLFLTRSLARLRVDAARYRALFGSAVGDDFPDELRALLGRGLLREEAAGYALTEEGAFYADSAAGLLAWRRVQAVRPLPRSAAAPRYPRPERLKLRDPNDSSYGAMG